MENIIKKFTVAMDSEAKKNGDVKTVELEISFDGVSEEEIRKAAIANCVVGWQGQIRNNWDKFLEGELPEVVTFGVPLFESARKTVVPMTPEGMKEYINSLDPEAKAEYMEQLLG